MTPIAKNGVVLPENRTTGHQPVKNTGRTNGFADAAKLPPADLPPEQIEHEKSGSTGDSATHGTTGASDFSEKFSEKLVLRIAGRPAPGGSKTPFPNRKTGRIMMVDACKRNKTWREDVRAVAIPAMEGKPLMDGPIQLWATFYMQRPKSHYRTGKNSHLLKPNAPKYHTQKPDGSKLLRSTEDALTGIVWTDDARVAIQVTSKLWAEKPGARLSIREIPAEHNIAIKAQYDEMEGEE